MRTGAWILERQCLCIGHWLCRSLRSVYVNVYKLIFKQLMFLDKAAVAGDDDDAGMGAPKHSSIRGAGRFALFFLRS